MVYLIGLVHPKIYDIGTRLKIQKRKFSTYFLSKDHQFIYFSMLVPHEIWPKKFLN
jgi:hypothetical protein